MRLRRGHAVSNLQDVAKATKTMTMDEASSEQGLGF